MSFRHRPYESPTSSISYIIAEQIFRKKKMESLVNAKDRVYVALLEMVDYIYNDLVWKIQKGHGW